MRFRFAPSITRTLLPGYSAQISQLEIQLNNLRALHAKPLDKLNSSSVFKNPNSKFLTNQDRKVFTDAESLVASYLFEFEKLSAQITALKLIGYGIVNPGACLVIGDIKKKTRGICQEDRQEIMGIIKTLSDDLDPCMPQSALYTELLSHGITITTVPLKPKPQKRER